MRIEAFTEGKNLDAPDANEDQFVVLPGCGYAVIDGVTDISGRVIEGISTGRFASRVVQRAVAAIASDPVSASGPPPFLIQRISAALHATYVRLGMLEDVRDHPQHRFGATLTLALDLGPVFRFIFVGDSGLRINATDVVMDGAGLDRVTAVLRQEAFRIIDEAGGGLESKRRIGRLCSYFGAARLHQDMRPWLDATGVAVLRERSLAASRKLFPDAPIADIRHLVDNGISGQTQFQNNTSSPFSYSVFDGFEIPFSLVKVMELPRASLSSIELFTDGYFKVGATADVGAWESAFAEVERVDPEKIAAYPSVKGSSARTHTDDRTVLIVHL